ncbi:MAG: septum site-determining protein MinC [Methyloprofundus sp.]|nr:MAG: septum site-determining protein MinC [Methyloprofundus sp.]
MSTEPPLTPSNAPAFELKSGVVTVPALNIFIADINIIAQQLRDKIQLAPEFFTNSAILIDLHAIQDEDLNLALLVDAIRNAGMHPIGIRGGSSAQQLMAKELMLSVMASHNNATETKAVTQAEPAVAKEDVSTAPAAASTNIETITIEHPIRSGQRVYAKGDLVVLAQVSAGAEIMAEGNIHVYGSLRGRALAGVLGNENVRIFCSDLQAELISIAGNYRVSEDIDDSVRATPVQIHLSKQALIIKNI